MATNAFIGNSGINNSVTLTNNGVLQADTLFIGTFPSAVATLNIGNGGVPGSVVANGIVGGPGVAYIFFNHTANPYLFSVPISGLAQPWPIGPGTSIFTAASTFFGSTEIDQGTMQAGGTNVFSPLSTITALGNGTLNLAGFTQTTLDIVNEGILRFGTPGVQLTINGGYTQDATSNLIDTINFAAPAT